MDKEIVNRSLAQGAPPTVLGERPARIPTGGTIRAGIKVLTKAAASNPQAKAIYEQGLASNCSFEEIGQKIADAFPDIKTPLVPKNVAWFTVRPNDFPNPALAAQILAAFGEDRGDGVIRLYRFPVIFPADTWQLVMPHELAAWARNDKRYWSEYASDGHTRYCKMYAPVRFDERSQRVVRTFGGRPVQLRPENNGVCDPENCPEFQNRQCNLTGKFIFYIPGIASIDAFVLHTNSFYAMSRAIERFETISFMRGGRLAGFLDQHRTPFYFSKKLRDVSHIDPKTGQSVRSAHWIIELEAPIDVSSLLIQHDDESALHLADQAAHILQGQNEQQDAALACSGPDDGYVVTPEQPAETGASIQEQPTPESMQSALPAQDAPSTEDEAISTLFDLAAAYGVDRDRFGLFADRQWGAGWRRNVNGRQRVLAELERYQNDPEGFCDKVNARLRASDTPSSRQRAPTAPAKGE